MRTSTILLLALTILIPAIGHSQEGEGGEVLRSDSLKKQGTIDRISIEHTPKEGMKVKVLTIDSVSGEVKDTTKIKLKNQTIYIVSEGNFNNDSTSTEDEDCNSRSSLTNWAGIDIGVNGFMNPDYGLNIGDENDYLEVDYPQSRSLSINFWEQKLRIVQDYVGITTGAGLQWNNYRLKNSYVLSSSKDTLVAYMDSSRSVSKNKFRTTWVNVPLLLEFNTSADRDRSFHLAAGVIGGLHLGSMYKQKYQIDNAKTRSKTKNDMNVAPYRLEATVRMGYGSFNLFASYQLTELFEDGQGPELYPFTIGVTLVAF